MEERDAKSPKEEERIDKLYESLEYSLTNEASENEYQSDSEDTDCYFDNGNEGSSKYGKALESSKLQDSERDGTLKVKKKLNMREERKRLRNEGKEYVSGGKIVQAREIGEDCQCKKNCFSNVDAKARKQIFSEFWAMGDYNLQTSYLYSRLKVHPVLRRYTSAPRSRRNFSVRYTVLLDSQEIPICKVAFLNMHGLQKSRGRIETLVKKIMNGLNEPPVDRRGCHENRSHCYTDEQVQLVLEHIKKILKYTDRIYIGHKYTMKSLYENYATKFCTVRNSDPVSLDKYRKLFHDLNLNKQDTCKTFDISASKIRKSAVQNDAETIKAED